MRSLCMRICANEYTYIYICLEIYMAKCVYVCPSCIPHIYTYIYVCVSGLRLHSPITLESLHYFKINISDRPL